MSKLSGISGKACVKALQKVGFYQKRRESSHIRRFLANKIPVGAGLTRTRSARGNDAGKTCPLPSGTFFLGNLLILRRDEPFAQIVVPDHSTLAKGTLRTIIRDADLSIEAFIALL